jgi:hypothetical protein
MKVSGTYFPTERSDFFYSVVHVFFPVVLVDNSVKLKHDISILTPPGNARTNGMSAYRYVCSLTNTSLCDLEYFSSVYPFTFLTPSNLEIRIVVERVAGHPHDV